MHMATAAVSEDLLPGVLGKPVVRSSGTSRGMWLGAVTGGDRSRRSGRLCPRGRVLGSAGVARGRVYVHLRARTQVAPSALRPDGSAG